MGHAAILSSLSARRVTILRACPGGVPLQWLRLVPARTHPDVALFVGGEDDGHRLRVGLDDGVRRCRQESADQMWAEDRLGLGAPLQVRPALEAVPDVLPWCDSPSAKTYQECLLDILDQRT